MSQCVCKATRFIINLNDHIRFRPTEFGKTIYKLHWLPYTRKNEERDIELDEDGYAELQIHEFMCIFGSYMDGGMKIPIETSITLINKNEEQLQALKKAEKKRNIP